MKEAAMSKDKPKNVSNERIPKKADKEEKAKTDLELFEEDLKNVSGGLQHGHRTQ
jgi:hypothetical protein